MNADTLEFTVPTALRELGYSDDDIRKELPVLLVLKRFRQNAISSGKGASLLGITRREFLDLLESEGISFFEPGESDLRDEIESVRKIGNLN